MLDLTLTSLVADEDDILHADSSLSLPPDDAAIQEPPPPSSRQLAIAQVLPMPISHVVGDIAARDSMKSREKIRQNSHV